MARLIKATEILFPGRLGHNGILEEVLCELAFIGP